MRRAATTNQTDQTDQTDQIDQLEQALHGSGDLARSRTGFDRAFDQADREGDLRVMARAALGVSGLWIRERRSAADAAGVEAKQRQTLARLHPESSLAFRLRIRLAADADFQAGRAGRILPLLAQARAGDHPVALAEALNLAHHCLLGPEHAQTRLGLAEELLRAGATTHRPSDTVMGMIWRAADLFLNGDRRAERAFADLLGHEPARRNAAAAFIGQAMQVALTIRAGALVEAEAQAESCARAGASAGHPDWMSWYTAQLVAIRWFQGRIGELADTVSAVARSPRLGEADHSFLAVQALSCASAGDTRAARGALARLTGRDLAELPTSGSWLASMAATIETAALLGDTGVAERAYTLLRPYAHLPVAAGIGVACLGSAQHPLGVACLVTGDAERAVEHFDAAIAHNCALGHWPAATLSRHRLAQALATRGAAGDAHRARAAVADSVAEAAELGMVLPALIARRTGPRQLAPVCTRRGRRWRIELQGRAAVVDDMVGLRHLATLTANPGVGIPAIDLAEPHPAAPRPGAQPLLDAVALRQYRARLQDLAELLTDAEDRGDGELAGRLQAEAEWLAREVTAGTGLGGRSRTFTDDTERARISVGKAIRRALDRVAAADATIGDQMRASVETGVLCCYRPAEYHS